MNHRLAAVAAFVMLAACGGPSGGSGGGTTSPTAPTSSLEAALSDCANDQQTVYDALQESDLGHALRTLEAAQAACHDAAAELRRTPLPSLDPVKGPAAIDEMAAGLGQVAAAVRQMDRSPARARRSAQQGMHTYQAGLAKFTAAKR